MVNEMKFSKCSPIGTEIRIKVAALCGMLYLISAFSLSIKRMIKQQQQQTTDRGTRRKGERKKLIISIKIFEFFYIIRFCAAKCHRFAARIYLYLCPQHQPTACVSVCE